MLDYFKGGILSIAGASCSRWDARRLQLGAIGPYQPSGGVHAGGHNPILQLKEGEVSIRALLVGRTRWIMPG